ncbi:hypothetical protein G3446_02965 [Thiorhodococcus minor]|uniref:Carboxypeptidase regulatory-like domain-containing protein n=2 Tax=Thiorhodococcus minor TaxID=57489 RepID=A0A6M0JTK5_9GAMM|nr:hypothetical protein [Thiorhodococcus minor]
MGSAPASAHKLKVFASAVGDQIQGGAYFAGGGKAGGASILIQDGGGRTLAELQPDANGRFTYFATEPGDHLVVAKAPDGHQATWRISAAELAPAFPTQADDETTRGQGRVSPGLEGRQPSQEAVGAASAAAQQTGHAAPSPQLPAAIELAVARQIRPLREQLAAAQDRARLTDILGGIGYIIGIMGLALWWKSRRAPRDTP